MKFKAIRRDLPVSRLYVYEFDKRSDIPKLGRKFQHLKTEYNVEAIRLIEIVRNETNKRDLKFVVGLGLVKTKKKK